MSLAEAEAHANAITATSVKPPLRCHLTVDHDVADLVFLPCLIPDKGLHQNFPSRCSAQALSNRLHESKAITRFELLVERGGMRAAPGRHHCGGRAVR